jgi:hypothetical protein
LATVIILLDIENDRGARGFGCGAVRYGIVDDDVAALRLRAADLVGLFHKPVELGAANGPKHDHGVGKGQHGIKNGAVFAPDDMVLLKAKGPA